MALTRAFGRRSASLKNVGHVKPAVSFYDLEVVLNNHDTLKLSCMKGKKVLLVNTASDCGYTNQYAELQELQERFRDTLAVIGFPSNDFKEQEKGSDEEIAAFCHVNYDIRFPLAKKSAVTGPEQNSVFRWLSDKRLNGWNTKSPGWNFSKYLVDEEGVLTNYFDPGISPLGREILQRVNGNNK